MTGTPNIIHKTATFIAEGSEPCDSLHTPKYPPPIHIVNPNIIKIYPKTMALFDEDSSSPSPNTYSICGFLLDRFSLCFKALHFPFKEESHVDHVQICVKKTTAPKTLNITIITASGDEVEFIFSISPPTREYEWLSLKIERDSVVKCIIQGTSSTGADNVVELIGLRILSQETCFMPSCSSHTPSRTHCSYSQSRSSISSSTSSRHDHHSRKDSSTPSSTHTHHSHRHSHSGHRSKKSSHSVSKSRTSHPKDVVNPQLSINPTPKITEVEPIRTSIDESAFVESTSDIRSSCDNSIDTSIDDKDDFLEVSSSMRYSPLSSSGPQQHPEIVKYLRSFLKITRDPSTSAPRKMTIGPQRGAPKIKRKSIDQRDKRTHTLTNGSLIDPLCVLGIGGFGVVSLINIKEIDDFTITPIHNNPCILKQVLEQGDHDSVLGFRKEFKLQRKVFRKVPQRIPRPLYMLDLLDESYNGSAGFCMEFCRGGCINDFVQKWCRLSEDPDKKDEDSESTTIENSEYENDFEDSETDIEIGPSFLDPVRVSSVAVDMIECLADVFKKCKVVHRDIKPENFLVRVDPETNKCCTVLADLGMTQLQEVIDSSSSSRSFQVSKSLEPVKLKTSDLMKAISSPPKSKSFSLSGPNSSSESSVSGPIPLVPEKTDTQKGAGQMCGTLDYFAPEYLGKSAVPPHQKGDVYSLGMSIIMLFKQDPPFSTHDIFVGVRDTAQCFEKLHQLHMREYYPKVSDIELFKKLANIESGRYKPVYDCLSTVCDNITKVNHEERWDVQRACDEVQKIKDLLPEMGEGYICPTVDETIARASTKWFARNKSSYFAKTENSRDLYKGERGEMDLKDTE
ncbi:hypothetical protein ADUPG1_013364 [Aduncisulcus paluster]|uniref:Protein kinase domain-containing protein n=1 Tax=Aduncisulcus paluster TaxID=2918883 RepID=A0ABQ5K2Q3_9EUKA|nr:hypothetical protein ADUPG1_013364 [Aduncisulcus paluster]